MNSTLRSLFFGTHTYTRSINGTTVRYASTIDVNPSTDHITLERFKFMPWTIKSLLNSRDIAQMVDRTSMETLIVETNGLRTDDQVHVKLTSH